MLNRLLKSRRLWLLLIVAAAVPAGCASIGYYGQSIQGHLDVMARARPVNQVIRDGDYDPQLRARLEKALTMREFASRQLGLPDNASYRFYADLERPYVVWNVFAAPEFSIEPTQWCFFIVGCVSYRGYYDRQAAQRFADGLAEKHLDVYVGGVPAYSTLGWFDDPLLNTMLNWSDTRLARQIFHELAHQVVFIKGDTAFNEGFASAVERIGIIRWLEAQGDEQALSAYLAALERQRQFEALLFETRDALATLYARDLPPAEMRRGKASLLAGLEEGYATLKSEQWNGYDGYDGWFDKPVNNARLGLISDYGKNVPAFLALLAENGNDLTAFYAGVERIGGRSAEARRWWLGELRGRAPALGTFLRQPLVQAQADSPASRRR